MNEADRPLEFFPIGIGDYADQGLTPLGVDAEIERLRDLLSEFGAAFRPWDVPMRHRGADAIGTRLRQWADPKGIPVPNTVLYWVSHGWSNGATATLAHYYSPQTVGSDGIHPRLLADKLTERELVDSDQESWAIVIIDACQSTRFVQLISSNLDAEAHGARRALLIGTSGQGSTWLGIFTDAVEQCLTVDFHSDDHIELWALARQLKKRLQDAQIVPKDIEYARLIRTIPRLSGAIQLDAVQAMDSVVASLSDDEQRHFLPKAQGGELGEMLWFYEGREHDQRRIVRWLESADRGMFIVTGRAGSGKSALLGYLLIQSRDQLRTALHRSGLLPSPHTDLRPRRPFDIALLLTNASITEVIERIAEELELGPLPAEALSRRIDWLLESIRRLGRRLTVLVDGLDEAQQPIPLAKALLGRLASIDGLLIIVGTRRSDQETLDQFDVRDTRLINALEESSGGANRLTVFRDQNAIFRYVRRRLVSTLPGEVGAGIDRAAHLIANRGHDFLFARLAVHEILSQPQPLADGKWPTLAAVLSGNHLDLFEHAVDRLSAKAPVNRVLLTALAHGEGRGLPTRDNIWGGIASAITRDIEITPRHIDTLVRQAAPYLLVDTQHDQTVYRLAHRSFQEVLLAASHFRSADAPAIAQRIAQRLMASEPQDGRSPLNSYIAHHLGSHVGKAGQDAWLRLADRADLLDRMNPLDVAAAAIRARTKGYGIPSQISGFIAARHTLQVAAREDRRGLREIAAARYGGATTFADSDYPGPASWTVRSAWLRPRVLHLTMSGHTGWVQALATLPDDRIVSVGGHDGTGRIWDAVAGVEVTQLSRHPAPACSLLILPGSQTIAIASADRVCLWDADDGQLIRFLPGPQGGARFLAALPDGRIAVGAEQQIVVHDPAGRRGIVTLQSHRLQVLAAHPNGSLVTGDRDGTVRLVDPDSGRENARHSRHTGFVRALAVLPDGRIASAGQDGTVRIWDPGSLNEPRELTGHLNWVLSLAALPDGRVVSASHDRTVRVWDPATGSELSRLAEHTAPVQTVAVLQDGRIVSGGYDGTIRVWDQGLGARLTRHDHQADWVQTAAILPDGGIIFGGNDGALRVWDMANGEPGVRFTGHAGCVQAVAVLPDGTIISGGDDQTVRVWDRASGEELTQLGGQSGGVRALAVLPDGRVALVGGDSVIRLWNPVAKGAVEYFADAGAATWALLATPDGLLVAGGHDQEARVWDVSAREQSASFNGHDAGVLALAMTPDGAAVSSGQDGTVRIWDLRTGAERAVLAGHDGWVRAVAVLPGGLVVSGGEDGTVRLWDPRTAETVQIIPIGHPVNTINVHGDDIVVGCDGVLVIRVKIAST